MKPIHQILIAITVVLLFALIVPACTAVRVISTEAKSIKQGDTTTTITTKTVERYDASKK